MVLQTFTFILCKTVSEASLNFWRAITLNVFVNPFLICTCAPFSLESQLGRDVQNNQIQI